MPVSEESWDPFPTLPPLPHLLQASEHLKQAWTQAWTATPSSPPPNLADFLPATSDPLRSASLRELIRVDLEMRWKRGLRTLLEFYVQQFPELGEAAALPTELIYHEYRLRRQHDDQPALTDYQQRFPTQYPHLLRMTKGDANRPQTRVGSTQAQGPALPTREMVPISVAETLTPELSTPTPADSGKKRGENSKAASVAPQGESKNVVPMVGGYRLLQRLGRGASGEVWKAEAPGGVEVAVKRLKRTLKAHEAQSELQSLEHVKRLRHNYLSQIHAFWVHKGRLHVAMELADGSLDDEVKRCRAQGLPGIPVEQLLRYMGEAAEALDFLHSENVLHRDIKPANILLLQGHVKVADFGLVRPLSDTQSMVEGTFCGTPIYMPPEVWDNKFSIHSDQWSLVITYLELRLNRRIFKGTTFASLMSEIRNGEIDLTPLAQAEQRVLRRALHPSPRQRYPSCTAFVQALEAVFHPPAPPPQRRKIWMAIALLACLNAAALLIAFFRNPRVQPETPLTEISLDTGREDSFSIPLLRKNYSGPVHLVPDQELPHITIIKAEARQGEDSATVRVRADAEAEPGKHTIHLQPTEENLKGSGSFALDLTILYLPAAFVATTPELEADDRGVKYYKRISRPVNETSAVEFVLVPRKNTDWQANGGLPDPNTFYISRFKISREQFRFIAEKIPNGNSEWRKHKADDDTMPVRDVTVTDADAVADWLGGRLGGRRLGRLPSLEQWDKAAGRYHPTRGSDPYWEGPYKGLWTADGGLHIAVGRTAPLPIDSPLTDHDESVYGCRDMAGNGSEWTRNTRRIGKEVPLEHPADVRENDVYLRGWKFENDRPLTFDRLDQDEQQQTERTESYKGRASYLGFRVVLEPNR